MTLARKTALGILFAASIFFLFVNIVTLKDGHNWGGDFSQYIRHAKNILEHRPYGADIMLDPWPVSPPGFPVLLAPLVKFFGVDFKILKVPNVLFWLLSVLFALPIIRKYLDEEKTVAVAVVLLTSPFLFIFKQNILSDVPFLCFAMGSVFLFEKYCWEETGGRGKKRFFYFGASLLFMFYAALIRTVGVTLFISAIFYFLVSGRDKRLLSLIVVALLFSLWGQSIVGVSGSQYMETLPRSLGQWCLESWRHIPYVMHSIVVFFFPLKTAFPQVLFSRLVPALNVLGPVAVLVAVIVFVYKTVKRNISFTECFYAIYLLCIIGWAVKGGVRYILPIAGLSLVFLLRGSERICGFLSSRLRKQLPLKWRDAAGWALLFMIFLNLMATIMNFGFNDDVINKKETQGIVLWMKEHMKKDDFFMFHNSRTLGLLTQRLGTPYWVYPETYRDVSHRIRRFGINYLIVKSDKDYLIEHVKKDGLKLELMYRNRKYQIFKILNPLVQHDSFP